jgi:hypothetical protein
MDHNADYMIESTTRVYYCLDCNVVPVTINNQVCQGCVTAWEQWLVWSEYTERLELTDHIERLLMEQAYQSTYHTMRF